MRFDRPIQQTGRGVARYCRFQTWDDELLSHSQDFTPEQEGKKCWKPSGRRNWDFDLITWLEGLTR